MAVFFQCAAINPTAGLLAEVVAETEEAAKRKIAAIWRISEDRFGLRYVCTLYADSLADAERVAGKVVGAKDLR